MMRSRDDDTAIPQPCQHPNLRVIGTFSGPDGHGVVLRCMTCDLTSVGWDPAPEAPTVSPVPLTDEEYRRLTRGISVHRNAAYYREAGISPQDGVVLATPLDMDE